MEGNCRIFWLASYPRSGNTWLRFLLSAYLFGPPAHWNDQAKASLPLHEVMRRCRQEGLGAEALWQSLADRHARHQREPGFPDDMYVKTHFRWSAGHPLSDRSRGAVLLLRHPRDVLLSALNFWQLRGRVEPGTEQDYARQFIEHGGDPAWCAAGYGTWEDHACTWIRQDRFPVHIMWYEALKQDPVRQFEAVLRFLSIPVAEARVREAVEGTSLERLRALEAVVRESQPEYFGANRCEYDFVNRGRSGQSLSELSAELDQQFDARFGSAIRALQEQTGALPGQ